MHLPQSIDRLIARLKIRFSFVRSFCLSRLETPRAGTLVWECDDSFSLYLDIHADIFTTDTKDPSQFYADIRFAVCNIQEKV